MAWKRTLLGILAATCLARSAAAAVPPVPPLGFQVDTSVPGQVTLIWQPASGATSYKVYRRVDPLIALVGLPPQWIFIGPVTPVATVTGTTFTDTNLPPLVRQFYVVTAANDDGESPLGLLATQLEVRVTAPPDAPTAAPGSRPARAPYLRALRSTRRRPGRTRSRWTDAVGNASTRSQSYDVAYKVCLLSDATKVKKAGSTVPIKLQLCDAAGVNLSRPDLGVVAASLRMVSTTTTGVPEDAGNANPDANFRYDAGLPGYIYNLQTSGLVGGTWELRFRIAGDPTEHGAGFQIR